VQEGEPSDSHWTPNYHIGNAGLSDKLKVLAVVMYGTPRRDIEVVVVEVRWADTCRVGKADGGGCVRPAAALFDKRGIIPGPEEEPVVGDCGAIPVPPDWGRGPETQHGRAPNHGQADGNAAKVDELGGG